MNRPARLYRPAGTALLRAAAAPTSASPGRWPDLDDAEACRSWLAAEWPGSRDAIALASSTLAMRIDQILGGRAVPDRQIADATATVVRYLLRAAGRPTPFAEFAGVAPARFTPDSEAVAARIGTEHTSTLRADTAWLEDIITGLEAGPLLERVQVVFNTLAAVRARRLTVSRAQGRAEIDYTDPVRTVAKASASPIAFTDLTALLITRYPAVPVERVQSMLRELVTQRFLITSLRAPMTVTDPLGHLLEAMRAAGANQVTDTAALQAQLSDIHNDIDRLNKIAEPADPHRYPRTERMAAVSQIDNGAPLYLELRGRLTRNMNAISPAERSPLSVDLALDTEIRLPVGVAEDMARAADLLMRLGPEPLGPPVWADYHRRFVERYGVGTAVPLLEVLDGASGLGYPAGYPRSVLPRPPQVLTDRDHRLLALAWSVLHLDGGRVLELDDDLIGQITDGDLFDERFIAPHVEIAARIRARSLQNLTDGRYTLAVSPARAAGTLTARFCQVTGDERMERVYGSVPTTHAGAEPVLLTCPPRFVRGQNVARHPAFLPDVLALGEPPLEARVRHPAQLALTATGRGLLLIDPTRNRVLDPQVYHALALERQMPPLARFLAHLPRAYAASLSAFDFGPAAAHLPHLPEVRYGRLLLAAERWRLTSGDLPAADESPGGWHKALERWRAGYGCPEVVELVDGDMTLRLDLAVGAHVVILREHVAGEAPTILHRAPEPDAYAWLGHAHEVVAPVFRAGPGAPTKLAEGPLPVRGNIHGHRPADQAADWISARIHTHPDAMAELIATALPSLAQALPDVPLWLVRYRNAEESDHLRIRVAAGGEHSPMRTAALGAWAADLARQGTAGRVVLDSYFPEVGRYGTGLAMAAAETVFCADTACVISALAQPPALPPDALTALSMLDIAEAFLGGMDAAADYFAARSLTRPQTIARSTTTLACGLARLGVPRHRTESIGLAVAAAWTHRAETLAAYRAVLDENLATAGVLDSLLHLHFNRYRGIDRLAEAACVRLARSAALAWRAAGRGQA